ncbi:MAG: PPOX class F420-dependent oxidoreductase [Chloroflexi bacterium]|nr:PPOX class F420-dependent oxidoreductase [Chloroflexota bacterium]
MADRGRRLVTSASGSALRLSASPMTAGSDTPEVLAIMLAVPESHRDLLTSDVAILATIGPDGYPQVTALWFLLDDDTLAMSLNSSRQKTRNLRAHPECTLLILDRANPHRYIEIRARAELSPDDSYAFADKVGKKYGVNLRAMDRAGESRVVVTLHPIKINAVDLSR